MARTRQPSLHWGLVMLGAESKVVACCGCERSGDTQMKLKLKLQRGVVGPETTFTLITPPAPASDLMLKSSAPASSSLHLRHLFLSLTPPNQPPFVSFTAFSHTFTYAEDRHPNSFLVVGIIRPGTILHTPTMKCGRRPITHVKNSKMDANPTGICNLNRGVCPNCAQT